MIMLMTKTTTVMMISTMWSVPGGNAAWFRAMIRLRCGNMNARHAPPINPPQSAMPERQARRARAQRRALIEPIPSQMKATPATA